MPYNREKHHRRSIRLRGYDYSQNGAYFVTLCVQQREYLFGKIFNDKMQLNEYGEIVREEWLKTQEIRPNIIVDEFVVMPNHVHGIVIIKNAMISRMTIMDGVTRATGPVAPTENGIPHTRETETTERKLPRGPKPGSIGAIIGQCKSVITKRINLIRQTPGRSVWQRDFYDCIGRDPTEIFKIRQYIRNNPANWHNDDENS
jgi:putative transposase